MTTTQTLGQALADGFFGNRVVWGMSKRSDGQMRWVDHRLPMPAVRAQFLASLGFGPWQQVSAGLVHGKRVALVTNKHAGRRLAGIDALVTSRFELLLTVTASDCAPIFFANPVGCTIGLAHAGWKGVLANVAGATATRLWREFMSEPSITRAFIGPHLRRCCFSVKSDVAGMFTPWPRYVKDVEDGKFQIDLAGIVREQLVEAGLQNENILEDPACTFCHPDQYSSYRRDHPPVPEGMLAYIALR